MCHHTLADFLATDVNGAFEFARRLSETGEPPSQDFLNNLKHKLSEFDPAEHEEEGSADWAHLVAGLMIARDWDPDGFAAVAAPFLACKGTAVWTAAQRLLIAVSRLDHATHDAIAIHARYCPSDNDDWLAQLRGRID